MSDTTDPMPTLTFNAADVPPGSTREYFVGDRLVLVANLAGEFYALQGSCTHEDLPLAGGKFFENVIACPHHGSRFNVCTGKVLTPPAEENLRTYPVRLEGERVVVTIS